MATIGEARIELKVDDSALGKLQGKLDRLDKASLIKLAIDTTPVLSKLQVLQKQMEVVAQRKIRIPVELETKLDQLDRTIATLKARKEKLPIAFEVRDEELRIQIKAVEGKLAQAIENGASLGIQKGLEDEIKRLEAKRVILKIQTDINLANVDKQLVATTERAGAVRLQAEINTASVDRQLAGLKEKARELNREFYNNLSEAFSKAGQSVSDFGSKVSALGSRVSTFTLAGLGTGVGALTALGVAGLNSAQDLQKARISFNVLAGSVEQGKKSYEDFYNLSQATPFDFPEIANAGKNLLAYGLDAQATSKDIRVLADLSAATGADLEGVSFAYGQVAGKTKLTGEELRQLNSYLPVSRLLTQKLGISTGELAERVKDGLIPFSLLQETFREATEQGGFAFQGTIQQSKTLSGQISILRDNVGQLTRDFVGFNNQGEVVQGGLVDTFTGILNTLNSGKTKSALQNLSKTLGSEIGKVFGLVDIGNLDENLSSRISELSKNLPGIIESIKKTLQEFGNNVKYIFSSISSFIQSNGPAIQEFLKKLGDGNTTEGIIKVVGALILLGPALSALGTALSLVGGAISAVSGIVTVVGWLNSLLLVSTGAVTTSGALAVIWTGLGTAATAVGTAIAGFVAFVGAIPLAIAAVVVAIVGLIAWFRGGGDIIKGFQLLWGDLVYAFEASISFFTNLPSTLGGIFGKIGQSISDFSSNAWNTVTTFTTNVYNGIVKWVQDLWNSITSGFQNILNGITTWGFNLWSLINASLINIFNSVATWGANLWNSITTSFNNILISIGLWWNSLGESTAERLGFLLGRYIRFWFVDLPQTIITGATSILSFTIGWLGNMYNEIVAWIVRASQQVWNFYTVWLPNAVVQGLSAIYNTLATWGTNAYNWGVQFFNNLLNAFISGFASMLIATASFTINAFNSLSSWANNTYNAVVSFLANLPSAINGIFNSVLSFLISTGGQIILAAINLGSNIYNGIVNFLGKIPSTVSSIMNEAVQLIRNAGTTFYNNAKDIGRKVVSGIVDGFNSVKQNISNAVSGAVGNVQNFGKGLVSGLGFSGGGFVGMPSFAKGGFALPSFANGGFNFEVPKGDQILAGLRIGEHVTNQDSTAQFSGLLNAINNQPQSVAEFFKGTAEIIALLKNSIGNSAINNNNVDNSNNSRQVVINYAPVTNEPFSYRQMNNIGALLNGI